MTLFLAAVIDPVKKKLARRRRQWRRFKPPPMAAELTEEEVERLTIEAVREVRRTPTKARKGRFRTKVTFKP